MHILIDNYDSFTHNITQYCGELGTPLTVIRNDEQTVQEIIAQSPAGIIISPGPSDPNNAGICLPLVKACADHKIPLLGICLGHQTIGQAFGGTIIKTAPIHGKTSTITHTGQGIFKSIPSPYKIARYHSLIIDPATCPADLTITAQTEDGIIMAVQHKSLPIHGVQFHPESIATDHGHTLIKNFLALTK